MAALNMGSRGRFSGLLFLLLAALIPSSDAHARQPSSVVEKLTLHPLSSPASRAAVEPGAGPAAPSTADLAGRVREARDAARSAANPGARAASPAPAKFRAALSGRIGIDVAVSVRPRVGT